jgi:hypothetical protein
VVKSDHGTVIVMYMYNTMTIDTFSYQSWAIFATANVQGGESIQIHFFGETIEFYISETLWGL